MNSLVLVKKMRGLCSVQDRLHVQDIFVTVRNVYFVGLNVLIIDSFLLVFSEFEVPITAEEFVIIMCFIDVPNLGKQLSLAFTLVSVYAPGKQ